MKKIVCLLLVICIMLPLIVVQAGAAEQDVVEYITNNVDILPSIYRQLHPDSVDEFTGTSVEFTLPVTVVSTGEVGTYLDFDGNNGYMVIVNGNDVIKWEASGDLVYLKELDSTYYSVVDGFGFYVDDVFTIYQSDIDADFEIRPGSAYNGQQLAGEGTILNVSEYMIDRYDSHYYLKEIDFLDGSFEYEDMAQYSIYNSINSGNEGNCALTAVYVAMNYLKMSNKCPSLPASSARVIHHAEYDPFFEEYNNDEGYSIRSPITLPVLYYAIRHRAIDNYSYERYGINVIYLDNLIEEVSITYNAGITSSIHTLGSFETYIQPSIDSSIPVIISLGNSETYNEHAVVVTGYSKYVKTTTILGIDFKDTVTLLRIADGWRSTFCYFDWTEFKKLGTWILVTMNI